MTYFRILGLLVISAILVACTSSSKRLDGSYQNDPFTPPGITNPLNLADSWPIHFDRDPGDFSPADAKTKLIVLGTGMPLPNPYRNGPGYAVVVNNYPYIVDAGEGIWRSLARAALVHGDEVTRSLSPEKLKRVFITHLHEDHTVGIPSLLLNPFKLDIPTSKQIYGPKGTEDMVRHIVAAWTIDIEEAIYDGYDPEGGRAVGHDILFTERGVVFEDENVKVEAFRTIHGSLANTFAYRFTTADRVIVFTGDGGPYHPGIVEAARDADILVSETVTEDRIQYAPWGGDTIEAKKKEIFRFHFSPAVLARIANEANVKTLVLSHEQNYNDGKNFDRLALLKEVQAAGWEGEIHSSLDADIY